LPFFKEKTCNNFSVKSLQAFESVWLTAQIVLFWFYCFNLRTGCHVPSLIATFRKTLYAFMHSRQWYCLPSGASLFVASQGVCLPVSHTVIGGLLSLMLLPSTMRHSIV